MVMKMKDVDIFLCFINLTLNNFEKTLKILFFKLTFFVKFMTMCAS